MVPFSRVDCVLCSFLWTLMFGLSSSLDRAFLEELTAVAAKVSIESVRRH